jgi:hypothetical protein
MEARKMMAKKSRASFQKSEKERARQQKQHAKAQRGPSAPPMADDTLASADMHPVLHAGLE